MFDLISIGDCVIDTFIPLYNVDVSVDPKTHDKKLCLNYGDKIPVGPFTSLVAGNAANNAVGSARLKLKTAVYTYIGNDLDGDKIKDKFKEEGVSLTYVIEDEKLPSNHHVVLDYKGERTILIYHQPWEFSLPDLDKTRWVYLTSMSPSFAKSNVIDQLVNYIERTNCNVLYNPGTFQIKNGVKKTPRLLSLTKLFIVNKEEAKLILGLGEGESVPIKKLLTGLLDLGPKMVIITDGKMGSYGSDGQRFLQLGIFPAKLLEMTGSGDAFATGTLAAFFHGKDLPNAMRWGAANGASVVEQVGPQAGLLTYSAMQEKLEENSSIVAHKI